MNRHKHNLLADLNGGNLMKFTSVRDSLISPLRKKSVSGLATLFAAVAVSMPLLSSPAIADDYEWDPTYGYHEEEWYDPSDWVDPDVGVDYESEYYDDYLADYYGDYYGGYDEYIEDDEYLEDDYIEDDFAGVPEFVDGDAAGVYDPDYDVLDDDGLVDTWYGDNYYTEDWYDDEAGFNTWY